MFQPGSIVRVRHLPFILLLAVLAAMALAAMPAEAQTTNGVIAGVVNDAQGGVLPGVWGAVKLRMPTPRDGGTVGVYQGRIYVAGGQSINAISNSVSRALEAYDPATNTWTALPNVPLARHGQGGGVIGNRFHVVGGHITAAFSGGEPLNAGVHDAFEFTR